MQIPPGIEWLGNRPDGGREWLDQLPRVVDHLPEHDALLVERCEPGTPLDRVDPEVAVGVIIALVRQLSVPATTPFHSLADEAADWIDELPELWRRAGEPFERGLVHAAIGTLSEPASTQGPPVLLHPDLHAGNVLAAEREPWLAIDPKPLVGEQEFVAAPVIRDHELGHTRALVHRRFDRLTDELGLDRERARGWAFGQTVAWAFHEDRAVPAHVQTARWLSA